jgi:hypothetical protein
MIFVKFLRILRIIEKEMMCYTNTTLAKPDKEVHNVGNNSGDPGSRQIRKLPIAYWLSNEQFYFFIAR